MSKFIINFTTMGQLINVAELVQRNELPYNAHYKEKKIIAAAFENNFKAYIGDVVNLMRIY